MSTQQDKEEEEKNLCMNDRKVLCPNTPLKQFIDKPLNRSISPELTGSFLKEYVCADQRRAESLNPDGLKLFNLVNMNDFPIFKCNIKFKNFIFSLAKTLKNSKSGFRSCSYLRGALFNAKGRVSKEAWVLWVNLQVSNGIFIKRKTIKGFSVKLNLSL